MTIDWETQPDTDPGPKIREGRGCPICGEPRGKYGETCGLSCGQKLRRQRDGYVKSRAARGYVRVWAPGHPTAMADGYAREHRMVAWDHGILTDLANDVHHINGDKTDNRPENLEQLDRSEHKRHHVHWDGVIENQYGVFPLRSERCTVPGCDRKVRNRNLCKKHYLEFLAVRP